jgi:NhaP-type Na+/H+ or K+/H+ antiporter
MLSIYIIKDFHEYDQEIIKSIFARGLAAAAIAQIVLSSGINGAETISAITYTVIVFTIIMSSIRIFWSSRNINTANVQKQSINNNNNSK